ncbi:hypothetical protein KI387_023651, partial [Taxus chinensis]
DEKYKPRIGSQPLEQHLMWLTTSKGKKTQPHIHVIVRPAVPDNNISWQVFENDQQIVNFLQEEAEFLARNRDRLEQQYGDQ